MIDLLVWRLDAHRARDLQLKRKEKRLSHIHQRSSSPNPQRQAPNSTLQWKAFSARIAVLHETHPTGMVFLITVNSSVKCLLGPVDLKCVVFLETVFVVMLNYIEFCCIKCISVIYLNVLDNTILYVNDSNWHFVYFSQLSNLGFCSKCQLLHSSGLNHVVRRCKFSVWRKTPSGAKREMAHLIYSIFRTCFWSCKNSIQLLLHCLELLQLSTTAFPNISLILNVLHPPTVFLRKPGLENKASVPWQSCLPNYHGDISAIGIYQII